MSEPLNCASTLSLYRHFACLIAEGITTLFIFVHIPSHLSMVKCGGSRFQFCANAAIYPWFLVRVGFNVEMCLLLELCEAYIWPAISEAGNSNELILCSRANSGSSILVMVLMRASFMLALDGFWDST